MKSELKLTPLHQSHLQYNARMTPFGGWDMPVQYQHGILHEVEQVRNNAGIFDVSHMGRFEFSQHGAGEFLDTVLSVQASALRHGQAKYHMICDEKGGIIDDAIVYNLMPERFLLVVNAGNADRDREWLLAEMKQYNQKHGYDIQFTDISRHIAMIALQGPKAVQVMDLISDGKASKIRRFRAGEVTILNKRILVARTGYTGEDGFEIMFDAQDSHQIWKLMIDSGAAPCGLGARDVLRLEAGMLLHGSDMTVENNPYEAGLGWTVAPDRAEYIAGQALRAIRDQGVEKRMIGFIVRGRGIARQGYSLIHEDERVGSVTSGSFSPTLNAAIGIGYVQTQVADANTKIAVEIRGKTVDAEIVGLPFYKPTK